MHSCCENDHLVDLSHFLDELLSARPDQEVATLAAHLKVVNESLVQVENQCVGLVLLTLAERWEVRSVDYWQVVVLILVVYDITLLVDDLVLLLHQTRSELLKQAEEQLPYLTD